MASAEVLELARRIVSGGDVSLDEYRARLDPDRRQRGDTRLLLAILAKPWPEPRPLSPRERDVLELAAAGLTSVEAAARLGIAYHTERAHRRRLRGKLGCRSMVEAVARGMSEVGG